MELWTNGASSYIVGEEKGSGLRGEVTRRQHHLVQGTAVAGAQKRRSGGATVMMRGELGAALPARLEFGFIVLANLRHLSMTSSDWWAQNEATVSFSYLQC